MIVDVDILQKFLVPFCVCSKNRCARWVGRRGGNGRFGVDQVQRVKRVKPESQ